MTFQHHIDVDTARAGRLALAWAAVAFLGAAACDATADPADAGSAAAPGQIPTAELNLSQGDEFGAAVAVSGTTVAVGAPGTDCLVAVCEAPEDPRIDRAGAVYVFERAAATVTLQARLTLPPEQAAAGDRFGSAVSLDGDVLSVGAPGSDGDASRSGAVYLFQRAGQDWVPIDLAPLASARR